MTDNIIKFHSYHPSNKIINKYEPEPVKNKIPQWFLEKDKFKKNIIGKVSKTRIRLSK